MAKSRSCPIRQTESRASDSTCSEAETKGIGLMKKSSFGPKKMVRLSNGLSVWFY